MIAKQEVQTDALVVHQVKDDFELTKITMGPIRPDEVLVEIKFTGVCHTDIVFQRGLVPSVAFPAIFGHEGAGVVKEVGSAVKDKSLRPGDNVLLSFNNCEKCTECLHHRPARCHNHPEVNHTARRPEDGTTPAALLEDGSPVAAQFFGHSSFAKLSVVKENCIVKCPFPELAPCFAALGCGFQTGAGTVLNALKPSSEQSIVIYGMGSVGLTAVMAAVYLKAKHVVAIDLVPSKLSLAKALGATCVINSRDVSDLAAEVKRVTGGGADFAIDCTGVVKVIEGAIESLAPCGTAAVVGVPPAMATLQLDPLTFLLANKRLIGVIEGDSVPKNLIPQLLDLHKSGHFPIDRLCQVYDVKNFKQAFEDFEQGKVIKPIIQWT